MTGNRNYVNLLTHLHGKVSKVIYFWQVWVIWNHCVPLGMLSHRLSQQRSEMLKYEGRGFFIESQI